LLRMAYGYEKVTQGDAWRERKPGVLENL
jgi:hypothetical protein